jgi:hypothetical protein
MGNTFHHQKTDYYQRGGDNRAEPQISINQLSPNHFSQGAEKQGYQKKNRCKYIG